MSGDKLKGALRARLETLYSHAGLAKAPGKDDSCLKSSDSSSVHW